MLVLFDIDATLLLTDGAGMRAMHDAGRELFGEHFTMEGVEFSGRLDPLIWADLARINTIADADSQHDRFRAAYGQQLKQRLRTRPTARLLPGVRELVELLAGVEAITLGLLTGNYPETGSLKIRTAGLDPDLFKVAAWGHEGRSRRDLPLVAMRRHAELLGTAMSTPTLRVARDDSQAVATRSIAPAHLRPLSIEPRDVVIIGDTPHDIDCAKTHGCRSIGVATGQFSRDTLAECGADLAVENLAETLKLAAWIQNNAR